MTALPGFQGSENTGVEVTIYRSGLSVGGIERAEGQLTLTGRTERDSEASIVSATMMKSMAMAGQFTVVVKVADDHRGSFLNSVQDDDWLDLSYSRHAKKWHVMRGTIDEVRRSQNTTGAGSTSTTYTIIGRDFQKIFDSTPIWFNLNSKSETLGGMSQAVFDTMQIGGTIPETTEKFLFGFLRLFRDYGRANWMLPKNIPNGNGAFESTVVFDTSGFSDSPERVSVSESFMGLSGGMIWGLAKTWSDPMFCELYTEQTPTNTLAVSETSASPLQTQMSVVLRDKPFPVMDPKAGPNVGKKSLWFSLPITTVPRQQIVSSDLGVQGYERFNSYFYSAALAQESVGALAKYLEAPLWDRADILQHGLRRFDASSQYEPYADKYREATDTLRARVRDWYVLNPFFLSGSFQLGVGMPYVKIGTRLLVPGESSPAQNETYYIEQVTHSWSLSQGMRTNLGVTRGWRGTDDSQMAAIAALGSRYTQEGDF